MRPAESGESNVPDLGSEEKQRIQRANQISLRLRKELHDRGARFADKDVREAAQGARWLREIVERHPAGWEKVYEDALARSDLTGEDSDYLQKGVQSAGGFVPFVQNNLQKLEEAAPGEGQTGDSAAQMSHQDFVCRVAAGIIAGGVFTGNLFYFGFGVGMLRKAGCW